MAARGERRPEPTRRPPGADGALHGREPETERIRTLIEAARAGRGGVLVVEGEPGSGKTALMSAAAASAAADGCLVLRAHGIDSGADLALSALADLLAPIAEHADRLPRDQRLTLRAALGPTFGTADEDPDPAHLDRADAVNTQLLLGTAVFSLLIAAASTERPLLLWIDDVHWLDSSSLSVLTFVARRITGLPIALTATRRGPEPAFGPPQTVGLRLAGLDEAAARRLLAEHWTPAPGAAGRRDRTRRLSAEAVRRLLAETRGNPLALIEMSRLAAAGALDPATLAAGREPLPAGVQLAGMYHDQVVTLPERTREALTIASASFTGEAGPITAALLAAGLDPADLAPAEHAGLVELSAGRLAFHHPLLRSAVYHGASDEAVRDAHRLLAEALAEATGPAAREQRAWHRSYAAEVPDPAAADELAEAAAAAARRGALTAARQAYYRAATIAPTAAGYLIEAAVCARVEGDAEEALALLDAAEAEIARLEPDEFFDRAGLVAVATAGAGGTGGTTGDARADSDLDPAADPAEQAEHAEPAQTAAPADPLSLLRARIQAERARVELANADPTRLMTDLVTAATATDDRRHAVTLTLAAAAAGVLGAHYREAREIASQALAHALDPHSRAAAAALAGHITLLLGDRDAARDLTDAALAAFDPADVDVPIEAVVFTAWTRTLMRDWSPATHQLLDQAVRAARDAGALSRLPLLLGVQAELNQRAGHWDVALERAQTAADLGFELGQGMSPGLGLAVAARIAAYRGDRAGSTAIRSRAAALTALHDDHPVRLALRHAAAVLALDEDPAAATAELRRIGDSLDALGIRHADVVPLRADLDEAADAPHEPAAEPEADPFLMARRALRQAVALRERRHHAEARSLLEPAREIFRRLGAARWETRCAEELAKLAGTGAGAPAGQHRPKLPNPRPATLTEHEVAIAERVGAGLTNNEVAKALFISPKTVEYHLRNIYQKLAIRSRTELARLVAAWDDQP